MNTFDYKGQGCMITTPGNTKEVLDIIKQIDEFEFEYLDTNLIKEVSVAFIESNVFTLPCLFEYTGRFEADLDKIYMGCLANRIPFGYLKSANSGAIRDCLRMLYMSGGLTKENVINALGLSFLL